MLASSARGDGRMPLVVLLHGWPLDRTIWDGVAPTVAARGFRVLTPDLPGFGDSPRLPEGRETVEASADEVASLVRSLGPDPVAVAGHSFGGYVALALAERHPGLLAGLGLVASRTLADSEAAKQGRRETMAHVREHGSQALLPDLAVKLLAPDASSDLRERAARTVGRARPDGVIAGLAAMAARPDRTDVLDRFPGPVLVLHGEADQLIPVGQAADPAGLRARVERILLPAAGHMPMWEDPEATSDAVAGWAHRVFAGPAGRVPASRKSPRKD